MESLKKYKYEEGVGPLPCGKALIYVLVDDDNEEDLYYAVSELTLGEKRFHWHSAIKYSKKDFLKTVKGDILFAGTAKSEPEAMTLADNAAEQYENDFKQLLPFREQIIAENQAETFYEKFKTRDKLELYLTDAFKRFGTGDKTDCITGLEILTFAETTPKAIRIGIKQAFETALTQELEELKRSKTIDDLIHYCGSIFSENYEEAAKFRDAFITEYPVTKELEKVRSIPKTEW